MILSDLLTLWAKTGRKSDGSDHYHPLLCHMIDVGIVAQSMWEQAFTPALRHQIAEGLGLDQQDARWWVAFLAGLHDLGKASPGFQQKNSDAVARIQTRGLSFPLGAYDPGHGVVSTLAVREIMRGEHAVGPPVAGAIAVAIGGHHGNFPQSTTLEDSDIQRVRGDRNWDQARRALADALAQALGSRPATAPSHVSNATLMSLAGLVSVADWIGSDERYFPYEGTPDRLARFALADYGSCARQRTLTALTNLGWLDWQPSTGERDFSALFPDFPDPPRPVQARIVELPGIVTAPGIVVVELPTGEGKTEAAFHLADRWGVALGQRGLYVAMPTMATANQMFMRTQAFLDRRYADTTVNTQLLHSQAALATDHGALSSEPLAIQPAEIYGATRHNEADAGEWFTRRKRGLLAPFGVGTVDQAFLAALQSRHVFVRLFGLTGKTIVFDEVHAYDVYMSTLFERLLEWLAALGSSVVVLSATLPAARRRALIEAYARGAGKPLNGQVPAASYPRLTWFGSAGPGAESVAASEQSTRTLKITSVDGRLPASATDTFTLGEHLQEALGAGGCAAVICNTVRRAQVVYQALKAHFPATADDGDSELDLFHARYLVKDRMKREQRALRRFGKPGGRVTFEDGVTIEVQRPNRAVLVATQVIEQSLDLDFDLMVSDPAPVDLILQRSGRLHRHQRRDRPANLRDPTLWLGAPEAIEHGVPLFGRSNEAVYHPHILLRSWLALRHRQQIIIPDQVEGLIEMVYDDRSSPDNLNAELRAVWASTRQQYLAERADERDEATKRWLKGPGYKGQVAGLMTDPREEDAPDFHQQHQALTRLAEPSVSIICLYGTEEQPTSDRAGRDAVSVGRPPSVGEARRLLLRSVTVSDRRVVHDLIKRAPPNGWQRSALLRHHRCIVLDEGGRSMIEKYQLRLDDELGLVVEEQEGS